MEKIIELFTNSGFTAVIASLGAVIITGVINWQIDKNRERQLFARQILPKRMKAHGVILKALVLMHEEFINLLSKPPECRPPVIFRHSNKFRFLHLRNIIWLDSGVHEYCMKIHELLFDTVKSGNEGASLKAGLTDQEYGDFFGMFVLYNGYINNIIIKTSGVPLLDKTLSKMAAAPKKKILDVRKNTLNRLNNP
jgi:hypothetical protein